MPDMPPELHGRAADVGQGLERGGSLRPGCPLYEDTALPIGSVDTLRPRSYSMSTFVYRSLTPDLRRIRLINLLPRTTSTLGNDSSSELRPGTAEPTPETRVSCTISHVSLDRPPPYRALSYTWGDVNDKDIILVDGAPHSVTKSLEIALAHLTPKDEPLTLWIDALCIDQDDEVEKTEQVQQMQRIYSQAESVITWLGPAADNSDIAMDWIERYGSLAHGLGIGTKLDLRLRRLLQTLDSDPDKLPSEEYKNFLQDIIISLSHESYTSEDGIGMALTNFFKRAYWSRVWVVQEVVHANYVQYVCGNKTILEDPLHHSLRLIRNYGQYQHITSAKHHTGTSSITIDPRNPINILKIRRVTGPFPLIYLIRTLQNFRATDPRDRVFALLSFAADAAGFGLRPNYLKSYGDVYLEATLSLLQHGFWDILSLCEVRDDNDELPSWVPDFTKPSHRHSLQSRAMRREARPVTTVLQPTFSVSRQDHDAHISYDPHRKALLLQAKFVGEVSHVGTTWQPEAFRTWLQELRNFSRQEGSTTSETERLKSVWRTAVADQEIRHGNQKPRMSEELLEKVHNRLSSLDLDTADASTFSSLGIGDYLYQMQDIAYGRRPFCTKEGHFGIGPREMEPGDLLYILAGANVPYILRSDVHGKLRFVGEAYAHGIMDGEASGDGLSIGGIDLY